MDNLETRPLDTFEALCKVNIGELPEALVKSKVETTSSRFRFENGRLKCVGENCPKTLVCHDLKGGYNEDRFINGCTGLDSEPYFLTHWSGIHIFVYFSHHFITIPPVGWIDAGHKNGVLLLGTIISEFDKGEILWQQIFSSPKSADIIVDRCCDIAARVGFDGWLLNVENKISKFYVPLMIDFVERLTKRMHEIRPHSKVVWFDSITIDGDLKWQNELNGMNDQFFNVCDAIFLNYTWTDENLAVSRRNGKRRAADIFVGVDVFGRGCPGGGGFHCDFAMEKIRDAGLSAAIFAPAWTHEVKSDADAFPIRERKFWRLLDPYINMHGFILDDQFQTSLDVGCGQDCKKGSWWLNLSDQSQMPISIVNEKYGNAFLFATEKSKYYSKICMEVEFPEEVHHIPSAIYADDTGRSEVVDPYRVTQQGMKAFYEFDFNESTSAFITALQHPVVECNRIVVKAVN